MDGTRSALVVANSDYQVEYRAQQHHSRRRGAALVSVAVLGQGTAWRAVAWVSIVTALCALAAAARARRPAHAT